jgi:ATP-dependent DNA helicase RecQ
MIDYAYTDECLRRFILEYFGERMTRDSCDNCSNCLDEGEPRASRTFPPLEKRAIFRRGDINKSSIPSRKGEIKAPSFLTGQVKKERMPKEKLPEKSSEELDLPCHEDLFASLKEMRLKLARASNLPPFVIFHDRTLRAISQRLPQTISELLGIKGFGEYKVSAYGDQTIEVIRAYLKTHPEAKPLSRHGRSSSKSLMKEDSYRG